MITCSPPGRPAGGPVAADAHRDLLPPAQLDAQVGAIDVGIVAMPANPGRFVVPPFGLADQLARRGRPVCDLSQDHDSLR
ncbi:hypothetical protein ETD83_08160 [Actinomadura soli]|uniref:Uncharacterized protein n=1 Tax=Actinomadura soli TaxID=2508997 RepID=A0A5C4JGN1_9ACTN|nr:hypothetical protein [Actinomadura soli]TMR04747.1 hypothetical protein ETD83_08160 [Actinomadura soli]